ncbi:MAG: metal-dependent hydrolase [Chloroflexi bacterium]|nr:metal-dependent hydrolase [Chloroflexota bacterium]
MFRARAALPLAGLASVLVIDRFRQRRWPLVIAGLLDEAGHVVTALLTHCAFALPRSRMSVGGTLAGATLLDADHVPHHLGYRILTSTTERPLTHSAVSVGLVAVTAALAPRQLRWPLACAAIGAGTQLIRDMGTGSVPLIWPVSRSEFRTPYLVYIAYLLLCVCLIVRGEKTTS